MKKVYDVRWSETSEKDLTGIIEYIAGDSPSNAYEVFKEIKAKSVKPSYFSGQRPYCP